MPPSPEQAVPPVHCRPTLLSVLQHVALSMQVPLHDTWPLGQSHVPPSPEQAVPPVHCRPTPLSLVQHWLAGSMQEPPQVTSLPVHAAAHGGEGGWRAEQV